MYILKYICKYIVKYVDVFKYFDRLYILEQKISGIFILQGRKNKRIFIFRAGVLSGA